LQNKKALYAIVCEVLKHHEKLQDLAALCSGLTSDRQLLAHPHLTSVLLYEQLLGKGVKGKWKVGD